jgi:hypothetical protein
MGIRRQSENGMFVYGYFIIIISLSQSTAEHRPLQYLAISLDLRLLASSSCQPFCANRHSTWPKGVLHYVYLDAVSTPELVYPSGYRFYGWYDQPTATSACWYMGTYHSLKIGIDKKHLYLCYTFELELQNLQFQTRTWKRRITFFSFIVCCALLLLLNSFLVHAWVGWKKSLLELSPPLPLLWNLSCMLWFYKCNKEFKIYVYNLDNYLRDLSFRYNYKY